MTTIPLQPVDSVSVTCLIDNAWNMTARDGVIDLLNDILGVIQQYGHDCT